MDTGLTQDQVLKNLQNAGYKQPRAITTPEGQIGGAMVNGMITQDGTNPIPVNTLGDQSPVVLPDRPISSPYTGMGEQFLTQAKGLKVQEDEATKKYEESLSKGQEDIMSLITGIGQQEVKRQEGYQEQGVFDIKKQYDDIVSKMESANIRAKRQIEEIQKRNPTGMYGAGAQGEIDRIEKENASYQADRAIELAAIGRRYDTAREIVNTKIEAETSAMKSELDAKKFFFEFNKDMFTKAEQRQYESRLRSEEREIKKKEDDMRKIEDLRIQVLENGGSPALAQRVANAQNYSEAVSIAGSFAGDQLGADLKRLQIESLKADIAEKKQKVVASSPEAKALEARSSSLDKLSLVNEVLESPYLDQVVGLKNPFTYWTPGSNEQYVKNQLSQLQSALSLENRELLKGSGAVSDFEFRVLSRASSALGGNLSNVDTKKELRQIRGAFLNAAGLPAKVKIVDPVSGESQTLESTRDEINQAIADGLQVEYQ